MILIANPIYDVVFKFMMEDNKVAQKFVSTIIHEEVVELDFAHTSIPYDGANGLTGLTGLTVCHLDFAAKISTPDGYKIVAIELQKAKLPTDIMRFRNYLGQNYQSSDNTYHEKGDEYPKARQIYCIFLLNHGIGFPAVPMLEVNQNVIDSATGKVVDGSKNEFIESLHHRSWIIQIPQLKQHRRNDIETLLSIFDQDNLSADHHIKNVNEEDFPEEYRPIIRRLQMAQSTSEVRQQMITEDYYLVVLRNNERKVREQAAELVEKTEALEKAEAEKAEILAKAKAEKLALLARIAELESKK
jgi:phage regulator Rha-like protein